MSISFVAKTLRRLKRLMQYKQSPKINYVEDESIDIDTISQDPLLCPTIVKDVYEHLRLTESNKRPRSDYIEKVQKHIGPMLRAQCVNWLVHAAYHFQLRQDTLYLAVNFFDRYLSGNKITMKKIWSIRVACMVIASKYEEVDPPFMDEYSSFTGSVFSSEDLIREELEVLTYLKYEVSATTTWSFMTRYVQAAQCGDDGRLAKLETVANWIAELSLLSYGMLRFVPSMVAASSVFLGTYMLVPSKRPWTATLQRCTLYQPSDLRDCVLALYKFCRENSNYNGITANIMIKYDYELKGLERRPPRIPSKYFHDLYR